jgi:PPK2 family polyphosphate:nucleotide phosphotransferase
MIFSDVLDRVRVEPGSKVRLKEYSTNWALTDELKKHGKDAAKEKAISLLKDDLESLCEAQQLLFADDRHSVLVVLQAMDAAGKDGTIKHVMSGLNPQGCQVFSFKQPSAEDLDHNFLWRYSRCLPERGRIGIFNRSYYEELLVVKVHPELLEKQKLPAAKRGKSFWKDRYDDINNFEHHLVRNGVLVLKFFLHVSKDKQRERFLERLERPEKHWKFSAADMAEREYWDQYMEAFEDALSATSTEWAPWYVVPADQKWATHAVVSGILTTTIEGLDLRYPEVSEEQKKKFGEIAKNLRDEK